MSRLCPNCNHLRPADASVPEWQCPACGKAYNKGGGAAVDESYGKPSYLHPVKVPFRSRSPLVRLLIAAFFFGWAALYYWPSNDTAVAAASTPAEQPAVVMYATTWCGYCAAAREFFAANGIRYVERDIEQSSVFRDELRRLGGNGVPLIVVGEETVNGYNEARLRGLLKPWLKG